VAFDSSYEEVEEGKEGATRAPPPSRGEASVSCLDVTHTRSRRDVDLTVVWLMAINYD